MTMMHTSRCTDVPTADYYSLQTEWKLHHCVTDVRRQYPIAPLFRGDLVHAQTMCTRLSLRDSQNVSRGESGNEATDLITCQLFAGSCALSYSHHRHHGSADTGAAVPCARASQPTTWHHTLPTTGTNTSHTFQNT